MEHFLSKYNLSQVNLGKLISEAPLTPPLPLRQNTNVP